MLLGVDIGTTTVSGVLVDSLTRRILRTANQAHGADIAGLPTGQHAQCPKKILQTFFQVVETLCDTQQPSGVVLSGQMHGIVVVDRDLAPLTNLITWRDQRTADAPDAIRHHTYASETGCFLHPGYGGLTLFHLLKNGILPSNCHKAVTIQGFVQAHLTGLCSIDQTSAAGLGIWNVRENRWHTALLEQLGIPQDLLPDHIPSGHLCGRVRESFGLLSGATVYSSVSDNQAGVIGALEEMRCSGSAQASTFVIKDEGGWMADTSSPAVINVGTSGQISIPLQEYVFTPSMETRPMPDGSFIQVFATLCGGWALHYLADFFRQVVVLLTGRELGMTETLDALSKMAGPAGANGLRVDPRFAGERNGGLSSRGTISGITTENLTPQNLVLAFVEGIADELAAPVDMSGVKSLVAIGNAVRKNPLLSSAIERRFGMTCHLSEVSDSAAYGAACVVLNGSKGKV